MRSEVLTAAVGSPECPVPRARLGEGKTYREIVTVSVHLFGLPNRRSSTRGIPRALLPEENVRVWLPLLGVNLCPAEVLPDGPVQIGWCGYSAERPWNERILGFRTTPERISVASRMVLSRSHAEGPVITVRR